MANHLVQMAKGFYKDMLTASRHRGDFLKHREYDEGHIRESESSKFYFLEEEGSQLPRRRRES